MRCAMLIAAVLAVGCIAGADAADAGDYYRRGMALADAGEIEEAIHLLQEAVVEEDADATIYLTLGFLLEKEGRDFESLEMLLTAKKMAPRLDPVAFTLAMLYEKIDAREKALVEWKRFVSLSDDKKMVRLAKKHINFLETP